MCGILGIIEKQKPIDRQVFADMFETIKHRGPESEGVWMDQSMRIALAHRRLAIIDLSPSGRQPMISEDGRFVITFNGEVYNYKELKEELENQGQTFKTKSDTEVLLYAYARWGEGCLQKLNGMFAFAIWDQKEQKLFAARDRLGEKPFKYFADNERFIFASEIKAILADKTIERNIDWQAVDEALSFRFVSSPATGFDGIRKLPAGHFLIWQNNVVRIEPYWNAEKTAGDMLDMPLADLKKITWSLFVDSVKKRMVSDVPVGAFLSGGIDSTSVIAAMKELGVADIETFVISIGGESEDQQYAKRAAKYFGTNHHEIEIGDINYENALQKLVAYYDEPFFDQSALPSMLISEEIKKHVTVVLSGDGGDELFGGYDAYAQLPHMQNFFRIPGKLRKLMVKALLPISNSMGYRAEILAKDSLISSYTEYYALWKTELPHSRRYLAKADLYLPEFKQKIKENFCSQKMAQWFGVSPDMVNNAMVADIRGRLADGYLTKTDIATMCSALELRPPFLDHRLVELSVRVPSRLKIKRGTTKWLWKQIVQDKMPSEIITRKKRGFSIPLDSIIKNQLKNLVEDHVLSSSGYIAQVFSVKTIQKLWMDHLSNKADYSNHLWSLLILELWLKKYLEKY